MIKNLRFILLIILTAALKNAFGQATPTIKISVLTGTISACEGSASISPFIQQFTVSANNLTTAILATAPANFELSSSKTTGFASMLSIAESDGNVKNAIVYVRSAASSPAGIISGNLTLVSDGAISQTAQVNGTVNALPTVNSVANQLLNYDSKTTPVNFTGAGGTFTWTNNNPSIGLAASGVGNIPAFKALNSGKSPLSATITVTPIHGQFAYIANQYSSDVDVINMATNVVVDSIPVGSIPTGVTVSPDNTRVYVTNQNSSSLSVINTATNSVIATIPVGNAPFGVCISSDGSRVYTVNLRDNSVSIVNTATNTVISTITGFFGPIDAVVSADGRTLYVTNMARNFISVINTETNALVSSIPVGTGPNFLSLNSTGRFLYITDSAVDSVSVVSTSSNKLVSTIAVGPYPSGIAVTPDGSRVYVTNEGANSVSVINTAIDATIATITVGSTPGGISVSPDGANVYVANLYSNSVSVISTKTNTVTATINVENNPSSLGNFISGNTECSGAPVQFTITVKPASSNANLSSFKPSAGTISPGFSSATTSYTCSVSNAAKSITITPTAADATATITVNGVAVASGSASQSLPLAIGPNTITTIVTAQDGVTQKTYTLTVTRLPGTNDNLSALTLSQGTLSPVFASTTASYTATVANTVTSLTITPTTTDPDATIKVNGTTVPSGSPSGIVALSVGANTISVAVLASNGTTTKTYTVVVSRTGSSNANLSSFKPGAGTISPGFSSATTSYTSSVANAVTSITITPTTADATAIIKVNGTTVASGSPSGAVALSVGANMITTVVTAQDGSTKKTYTLTVTRLPGTNDNLSALTLSQGILSPAFASATISYKATVANTVTSLTVTPTSTDPDATVKVNGTTVTSGSPSGAVALSVGVNNISVAVTASNGTTTKTYTVVVSRTGASNANLSAFKPSKGTIAPGFSSATTSYTSTVANNVTSITITPTAADANATIKVNETAVATGTASGAVALAVGSNTINTVVTAQDGVTTKTYTLAVTRQAGAADQFAGTGISVNIPIAIGTTESPTFAEDGILIHQGVSPNGDGINDFLVIENIDQYPDNKLSIMNRNGQLIFEAKGYDNSSKVFDGHSYKNGQMQLPGTYFYQLDYTVKGIIKHKTGFLVLKY